MQIHLYFFTITVKPRLLSRKEVRDMYRNEQIDQYCDRKKPGNMRDLYY